MSRHGDYVRERRVTRTQPNASTQNDVLCPPELKSRKWKKVDVKVGSIVLQRWVPEVEAVTEALQQYNTTKESKISNILKRKRPSLSSDKSKRVR
jgi:hypothetical protein